jgi:hypothetical protein
MIPAARRLHIFNNRMMALLRSATLPLAVAAASAGTEPSATLCNLAGK